VSVTNDKSPVTVRKAERADGQTIISLIRALASYENLEPPDEAACARLVADAFAERPRFDVFLAQAADGQVVGYAFVFETYSTFLALPTLYLEDLFVLPEHRSIGAGRALFRHIIAEADRRGCGRLEWMVLDWNELAHGFYRKFNATKMDSWQLYRLTSDQFGKLLAD
jgi:GNAT superfamily N-acetyltransferase